MRSLASKPAKFRSVRALSEATGKSAGSIKHAVKEGRIPPKPQGGWDASVVDILLGQRGVQTHMKGVEDDAEMYSIARARKEMANAERAELAAAKMRGDLLPKTRVHQHVYALARQERSAWMTWPRRVGAELAGKLQVPPDEMTRELEIYVRRHLAELTTIEPKFDESPAEA